MGFLRGKGFTQIAPAFGPEITTKFYPDFDPETSSVDGYALDGTRPMTWQQKHDAPGSGSNDWHQDIILRHYSWTGVDEWYYLSRIIMTFDTSVIDAEARIVSATLGIYGSDKGGIAPWALDPAVYQSDPLSDIALEAADFTRLSDVILSDVIPWADIDEDGYNIFTLNDAGLAVINRAGITRLGIRDSVHDAPNIPPDWANFQQRYIIFKSRDFGVHDKGPYLEVTYRQPA